MRNPSVTNVYALGESNEVEMAILHAEELAAQAMGLPDGQKPPSLVKEAVISQVFGVSLAWLRRDRWQHEGKPPGWPYCKIGSSVRYELRQIVRLLRR